jgi:hypothetical protein
MLSKQRTHALFNVERGKERKRRGDERRYLKGFKLD